MNIFKQFISSIYSPKDIATFRQQGIGKTIGYVFFLTFLSIIPTIFFLSTSVFNGVQSMESTIMDDLPEFEIANGTLQANETAPITVENDGVTIIFDSNNIVKKDEILQTNDTIAILQDELVFISGNNQQSYSYSMLGDINIDKSTVIELIQTADSWLIILISIFAIVLYLFSVAMRLIEISIIALIGIMIVRIVQKTLPYRYMWRIAAYSITLSTVFFIIMDTLQTVVPNGALINWLISIIILMLAIKEIPHQKKEIPEQ
ncbi:DUF1189 domain-containing protein [Cytobacillus sp. FSL W7-1323]|uniref:DUF1189 domain-containing protein n=1 Tax=unclassified Cytobacillus TaxID=2675268 RepID=UPI002AFECB65|nr:DUF1189 domain-containing protein [Cytobacillus sp. OWB-43]MEA1853113.1 DUF1189 domain-containing protein [Cytobacillus sp. OWB-43]